MAKYSIQIKRSAVKEIKKLPQKVLNQILKKIKKLAVEPRPIGAIKLSSQEYYRVRIGNYKIIYEIKQNVLTIIIIKVAHRKNVYK